MITIYSLFWTIINCSLMAVFIFILRTRTSFITACGTPILWFLTICCILRVLFPVEFPHFQYVIADSAVYSFIFKYFKFILLPEFQRTLFILVILLWIFGALFNIRRLWKQSKNVQKIIDRISCEDNAHAVELLKEIDSSCPLPVYTCPGISVPVLAGYFHQAIYFPDYPYTDLEIHYILLHEYMHWKRKDIWKKVLINVICVIFWWNPAIYSMRREVSQLVEFHCDKQLTKNCSDVDVLYYLETLKTSFEKAQNPLIETCLYTIEFVNTSKNHTIVQRFDVLLSKYYSKQKHFLSQGLIVLLALVWMIGSYYFILQTDYDTPRDSLWSNDVDSSINKDVVFVADENNSYLEEQKDGSYLFYYNGDVLEISAADVEAGLYDFYPIKKYEKNAHFLDDILSLLHQWISP